MSGFPATSLTDSYLIKHNNIDIYLIDINKSHIAKEPGPFAIISIKKIYIYKDDSFGASIVEL
jgi:hypothetical protein